MNMLKVKGILVLDFNVYNAASSVAGAVFPPLGRVKTRRVGR